MGKVLETFGNGSPGAVSRSADEIVISVRNVSDTDIEFGKPVFLASEGGVPFNTSEPQDAAAFLGFAVRVADKTPETYPSGQFYDGPQAGVWKAGDVMEVLVRGAVVVPTVTVGVKGGRVWIRKSDGRLTTTQGAEGSTVLLENVRVNHPRDNGSGCAELIVNKRNII